MAACCYKGSFQGRRGGGEEGGSQEVGRVLTAYRRVLHPQVITLWQPESDGRPLAHCKEDISSFQGCHKSLLDCCAGAGLQTRHLWGFGVERLQAHFQTLGRPSCPCQGCMFFFSLLWLFHDPPLPPEPRLCSSSRAATWRDLIHPPIRL